MSEKLEIEERYEKAFARYKECLKMKAQVDEQDTGHTSDVLMARMAWATQVTFAENELERLRENYLRKLEIWRVNLIEDGYSPSYEVRNDGNNWVCTLISKDKEFSAEGETRDRAVHNAIKASDAYYR